MLYYIYMSKIKRIKLLSLLAYSLLAIFVVLLIRPPYIVSIALVLVPPSLINWLWLKNSRAKVLLFSLLATWLFAPPIELMARLANVWDVASIFPRPFGLIPLENMLFAFLNFFWILSFYEYFIDKDRKEAINNRLKYLVGLYLVFAATVFGLYYYQKDLVSSNYFRLAFITLVVPGVIIFWHNPKLLKKTVLPTLFFALIFFVYELASIKIGSWWWPGEYLLPLNISGRTFPLDDVIIWYFLSPPVLIGGYEFFSDNDK